MKNLINLTLTLAFGLLIILGCSAPKNADNSTTPTNSATVTNGAANNTAAPAAGDKPIAVKAADLTKEYDTNELAADGKYKDKMLAVTGKIGNIAETMGNVTVSLDGHNIAKSVMCNFDDAERANVSKLKKGQAVTLIGKDEGMTLGIYVGLQNCKIQ